MTVLETDQSHSLLSLQGKLDAWTVSELQDEFIRETVGMKRSVIIDMSQVIFLASMGIRMMVEAGKKLRENGHRLILLKPSLMVESSLLTSGLDLVIDIHHDVADAQKTLPAD